MQKLSTSLKKLENHRKPIEPSSGPLINRQATQPLSEDRRSKERLGRSLGIFFNTLKTYGKDASQLTDMTEVFLWALADYPYEKIQQALVFYAKNYSEMPAPADIVSIIERNGKPPFDRVVYVGLKQKPRDELLDEEWEYIREYEKWAINGGQ